MHFIICCGFEWYHGTVQDKNTKITFSEKKTFFFQNALKTFSLVSVDECLLKQSTYIELDFCCFLILLLV